MKKVQFIFSFFLLLTIMLAFSSCNKDCICRYYDNNNSLLNTEVYDGDEVSATKCADMDGEENVPVEVHDNMINASYVSCSAQ